MDRLSNYEIVFSGLKLGSHRFDFELHQSFFDLFDFEQEFEKPNLQVEVDFHKKNNFLELNLELSGNVVLNCDISADSYAEELTFQDHLVVKFGETLDTSDDEIWVIPHGEYKVNLAQWFYEVVLISIPQKKIHPDILSGKNQEAVDLLNKYAPQDAPEIKEKSEIDPRWAALNKLTSKDKH